LGGICIGGRLLPHALGICRIHINVGVVGIIFSLILEAAGKDVEAGSD
jgi:hypothetical protein